MRKEQLSLVLSPIHTPIRTRWTSQHTYRCSLKGSPGIRASSSICDGRNLLIKKWALVLVSFGCWDIVHPGQHVGLWAEGYEGDTRGLRRYREIREHLPHKVQLTPEVGRSHTGGLIHKEDKFKAAATLMQQSHITPEGLTQTFYFALCTLWDVAAGLRWNAGFACPQQAPNDQ